MYTDKQELLRYFRETAEAELQPILRLRDYKAQAREINTAIKQVRDTLLAEMLAFAERHHWAYEHTLNCVLHITYASYVVMLEYRNKVWPYEYMAFARRIGELWDPFCKETFYYSVNPLQIVDPPLFDEVQQSIQESASDFFDSLRLDRETRQLLQYHYNIPWSLVDSGGIQLELDLHFEQHGVTYNCDFKSGFSSNEKGNTNRLLLVASIYHSLSENEKTILFVRQSEDENNHYLQTLKNSGLWDVYCADDAYEAMYDFTGFDLRRWLNENATWIEDIDDQLRSRLIDQGIIKYLTW